ncbi:MAG: type I secretion system permease/ATPase [Pseudomonadota bacterium]
MAAHRQLKHIGEAPGTALSEALAQAKSGLIAVGVVSCFLNLLLLSSPLYMMQLFDRVLASGRTETLLYLTLIVVFALIVLGVLDAMRLWALSRIGAWVANAAGGPVMEGSLRLSLEGGRAGQSVGAQPVRDLKQVQSFLAGQGVMPLFDAPWAPLFILFVGIVHPWLGVLAFVSALALGVLGVLNERLTRSRLEAGGQAQIRGLQGLEATYRNAEVIEALGMTGALRDRWRAAEAQAQAAQGAAVDRGGIITGASKAVRLLAQVGVLGVGALLVLAGEVSPGAMIAGSILLGRALAPMEQLISAWKQCVAARAAFNRVQDLLRAAPPPPPRMALPAPKGVLRAEQISFRVDASSEPILRNVSFQLGAGEAMGVIGPSGAGKTSLCRIIIGVYRPTVGHMRLDGADICDWSKAELGPHLGYLPQDVELFSGTVAENIARMQTPESDAVIAAAKLADVHELILRLPQGYDTPIGERGDALSAGQRQRVGLARALYGEPTLLVLDEPNSNLDQVGEEALQSAIAAVKARGCTVVMVAHRPSALVHVDKVLLMTNGAVQAFGERDQVLAQLGGGGGARGGAAKPPKMVRSDYLSNQPKSGQMKSGGAA